MADMPPQDRSPAAPQVERRPGVHDAAIPSAGIVPPGWTLKEGER